MREEQADSPAFSASPALATVRQPASNGMQLTGQEWVIVAVFTLAVCYAAPAWWERAEPLAAEPDYRMPYVLSNDYWLYSRYAAQAAGRHEVLLAGDSVVWGQYVKREETLSHHLNELAGQERCANLGLDGAHPAALAGLLEYYGRAIRGKKVVLVCNPLWLSSSKHDLQDEQEFRFNHPQLVPQFSPLIPCYRESVSARLGIVIGRNTALSGWTSHLQAAYFRKEDIPLDIPSWTLEHPYENPVRQITFRLPPSGNLLRHAPVPWYERGIQKQDFPWVDLEASLQWRSFLRCVEVLRSRGNRVLVVVGPFNEHMLAESSRERYSKLKHGIGERLRALDVSCFVPEVLPSEEYADASHPLNAGYRRVAEQILRTEFLGE